MERRVKLEWQLNISGFQIFVGERREMCVLLLIRKAGMSMGLSILRDLTGLLYLSDSNVNREETPPIGTGLHAVSFWVYLN